MAHVITNIILTATTTTCCSYFDLYKAGASPYVKIIAASEQPAVYFDDDSILTIAREVCNADDHDTTASPVGSPVESPTLSPTIASATANGKTSTFLPLALSTMPLWLSNTGRLSTWLTALTLLASATWVHGEGHEQAEDCFPTLSIEVGIPGTGVEETYGETDHYLAATVDTVVWGYYGMWVEFSSRVV